jgi:hypothetical protein
MATTTQSLHVRRNGLPPATPQVAYSPVLISPKTARQILEKDPFARQRPLRLYHVEALRALMRSGDFRPHTEIHFGVLDWESKSRRRFLVNGQHTLAALGGLETSYPLTIAETACADLAAVGRLYGTFDNGLRRSWEDLTLADPLLEHTPLPRSSLRHLGGALGHLLQGFAPDPFGRGFVAPRPLSNPRIRAEALQAWTPEMQALLASLKGVGTGTMRRTLMRAGVLSVALATVRFCPQAAALFWPKVCGEVGLQTGDPELALLRLLRETKARQLSTADYSRRVAAAWGHRYNAKALRTFTTDNVRPVAEPMALAGTPHNGRQVYVYLSPDGHLWQQPQPVPSATWPGPR